jgi:riboflavin kinase / FMN adenylyltransferase
MAWYHTYPEILPLAQGCVAALGNFDGVHTGHQHLLKIAKTEATNRGLPLVALTFHPHPRTVVRPEVPFQQLQTLPERIAALQMAGAEGVAVVPFHPARAQQTPPDFIQEILVSWLNAKVVVVGENFRFGHKAAGTPATLAANPEFLTHVVPLLGDDRGAFSSTRLRTQE